MTTQLEQLTLAQVASLIRLSKRVGEINSLLSGVGAPGSQRGAPFDWYIDTTNNELYGPKGSNYWPTEGIPLGQPSDGKTMLVGGGGGSSGGGGHSRHHNDWHSHDRSGRRPSNRHECRHP
jgi:uncharacterized membrane protein YgcG